MKLFKIILICCFIGSTTVLTSCDKGFEDVNTSPDLVQNPNLDYTLPYIQLTLLDGTYYTNVTFLGQFMNQVSSYGQQFDGMTTQGGGNYHFDFMYNTTIKNVVDFLDKTTDPELVNYNSIGRIMKAYCFHTVTDLYGDVPYFEAAKGYLNQSFEPTYNTQQEIYADILNELQDAASKFDGTKKIPSKSDIIYNGDIEKWKKFAYSLILRLGLRMSKADPENAGKWIKAAVDGGVMQGNEDNCVVVYKPNTYYATISNGQCTPFVYYPTWKLAEPFVAILRDNQDPRIRTYSVLPDMDSTASNQKGLPPFTPANAVPLSLDHYSVSPAYTFGKYDAPFVHLSYAQVELMLAECVTRGILQGDARDHYEKGVTAAMKELVLYGPFGVIADNEIQQYLAAHPFAPATTDEALEMINTQYWVETHYNWFESFSNWRRTGYPKLDETSFTIPRRLTYPVSEVNINRSSVQKAIEIQGPDLVTTKIWWDK